mmetsp:Transcript_28188/g.39613  ORF Transcript_28188/g.39613 Transcript_28188/m.39613 type:complete len:240 (+) Transcript_28188:337-1056(+)
MVSRRSAYFHLLRSCFLCTFSSFLLEKVVVSVFAFALRAPPAAACACASSVSACSPCAASIASRIASSWSRRSCSIAAASKAARRASSFCLSWSFLFLESFSAWIRSFSMRSASASASFLCCSSICFRKIASSSAFFLATSSASFFLRSSSIFSASFFNRAASSINACFFCSFLSTSICLLTDLSVSARIFAICSRVISLFALILAIVPSNSLRTPSTCAINFSLFFCIFSTVSLICSI